VIKSEGGVKLLKENPSQSYGASSAVWNYTVSAATQNRWTRPASFGHSSQQAGGTKGWVDLGVGYML